MFLPPERVEEEGGGGSKVSSARPPLPPALELPEPIERVPVLPVIGNYYFKVHDEFEHFIKLLNTRSFDTRKYKIIVVNQEICI